MLALTSAARSHPAETHTACTRTRHHRRRRHNASGQRVGKYQDHDSQTAKKSGAWGRVAGRSRVRSHLSGTDSHRTR